jgi:Family of unknown function (DUF5684)
MDYSGPGSAGAYFATVFAVFGFIIVFELIIVLAAYVLMSIALSKFFQKVGVESWIAWVPYYRTWKWLEVGGQQGWFALLTLVPGGAIATTVFLCIGMYRTDIAFRKNGGFVILGVFLPWLWCFILGSRSEVYEPELLTAAGYPPPLAGFGSVRPPQ